MAHVLFRYILAVRVLYMNYIRYSPLVIFWPIVDLTNLLLVDVCRLLAGKNCAKNLDQCKRPKQPLHVYIFEACPFSRKIREALSVLDINHIVYPCPRETLRQSNYCVNSRFRPDVLKIGGQLRFPFIVDPNTDKHMYESSEIIKYLWSEYGSNATAPLNYKMAHTPLYCNITMMLCTYFRPCNDMGMLKAASRKPKENLELYGYESSPFVRRVREVLDMLELPYLNHVVPHGSTKKREEVKQNFGYLFENKFFRDMLNLIQVPILKDPNAHKELVGSAAIVQYLKDTYQTAYEPDESWLEYGVLDKPKKNE